MARKANKTAKEMDPEVLRAVDPAYWAFHNRIKVDGRPFVFEGHEYQLGPLQCDNQRQAVKKGAQLGFTSITMVRTIHGCIFGRYPQGVLQLFPDFQEVTDFSKARFAPLIQDNPEIAAHVQNTDTANIKRIGGCTLYMRGSRATKKIEGVKKSSPHLKSIPVDRIIFDECDEMDPAMIDLAIERLSHSSVKEEIYLSTPSIPDFGIDRIYQASDQRIWLVKCEACNAETCLEIEFPSCLQETRDGRVIRICKKCKREIFPKNGRWEARFPNQPTIGWWISQLNSVFVDPKTILDAYENPPNGNKAEVLNSKLGMAYIAAENQLTLNDVYNCCGPDPMLTRDAGPCAMGVDVGFDLNVVVGYRSSDRSLELCHLARVNSFNDLHDIAQRFNVKAAVIDMEPETRKAREWQGMERFPVYLCDYVRRAGSGIRWDEEKFLVQVNRTENCDAVHSLIADRGKMRIPRRSAEVDEYARQMTLIAKVLEEDPETGSREYRYRKLGDDHYYHATGYFWMAANRIGISQSVHQAEQQRTKAEMDFDPLDPFSDDRRQMREAEMSWSPF